MTAHILLVDDDDDDREFFCDAVESIAPTHECVEAKDGEVALALLNSGMFTPDYIFIDLNMPRVNGLQCLTELKKNEKFSQIPVIIYSTSRRKEDREKALALGAVHFISKPDNHNDLCEAIAYVLEKKWEKVR